MGKRYRMLLTGNVSEQVACDTLRKNGFSILKRNFMTRVGEIDIIASKGTHIHFIEVKSLNDKVVPFSPEDAVTQRKMKNIVSVAMSFLRETERLNAVDFADFTFHFDVAAIRFTLPYRVTEFKYYNDFYIIDQAEFHKQIY